MLTCSSVFRRITLLSWKKLQVDDWLMVLLLVPYTISILFANLSLDESSVNHQIARFLEEEMQILTIWLVKACLLVLYWRIS